MSNAGSALMGIGSARGEDRAVAASEMAVSSPLLEASIEGAHGVLLSIAGGSDLGLFEINEAAALVSQAAHAEANIIFGAVIDDALGDEVRVTVIAAGFDGGMPKRREAVHQSQARREPAQGQAQGQAQSQNQGQYQTQSHSQPPAQPQPQFQPSGQQQGGAPRREPAQIGPVARPQSQRRVDRPQQQAPAPTFRPSRPAQPADDDLDVPDFLK